MSAPQHAVELREVERFRFEATYPGATFGPLVVDESTPIGAGTGPTPTQSLATAVGHCMSATLFNSLDRAHVPSTPIRTTVDAEVGRNARGRLRVQKLTLQISVAPLNEEDRERFDHAVEIFQDFCTVSGAVREGIPIEAKVVPPPA